LISIAGTILNLTTILSLLNHKLVRQQPTTPFIISLATSDLIFSSATLPILATRFRERQIKVYKSKLSNFCTFYVLGNGLLGQKKVLLAKYFLFFFMETQQQHCLTYWQ